MKIKFLFGLVFVLAAFTVSAQTYVSPADAIQILESDAAALQAGTANVNTLGGVNNATVSGTGYSGTSSQTLSEVIYPQMMIKTAKEIQAAGNTLQGITNAKGFFDGTTTNPEGIQIIADVFDYITDLLTI